ncbi:flagellar protein FlaG [Pseudomonas sp. S5(2021)]|nr:flagellar protein FlaG [Pseudomonas sp. S5(2021)]
MDTGIQLVRSLSRPGPGVADGQTLPVDSSSDSGTKAAIGQARPASSSLTEAVATTTAVSAEELDSAIASIREAMQSLRRDLSFSLDDESGMVVVKVTDSDGELVRQIPSEEVLRLRGQLEETRSLLFSAKA